MEVAIFQYTSYLDKLYMFIFVIERKLNAKGTVGIRDRIYFRYLLERTIVPRPSVQPGPEVLMPLDVNWVHICVICSQILQDQTPKNSMGLAWGARCAGPGSVFAIGR